MNSSVSKTRFPITFIFDTETTGLPPEDPTGKHKYAPYSKWGNQCRLLQLAWQIRGTDGTLLHSYNAYVRPEGFTIPEASSAVHTITEEFLSQCDCKSVNEVLTDLWEALQTYRVECLVAHNLTFDYHILQNEIHRSKSFQALRGLLESLQCYCTYKRGSNYLRQRGIYHPGKLTQYYSYFVEPWETCELKQTTTLHRADSDVEVCWRLFEKLYPQTH